MPTEASMESAADSCRLAGIRYGLHRQMTKNTRRNVAHIPIRLSQD